MRVGCDFFHANFGFCFGIALSDFNKGHYSNADFETKMTCLTSGERWHAVSLSTIAGWTQDDIAGHY